MGRDLRALGKHGVGDTCPRRRRYRRGSRRVGSIKGTGQDLQLENMINIPFVAAAWILGLFRVAGRWWGLAGSSSCERGKRGGSVLVCDVDLVPCRCCLGLVERTGFHGWIGRVLA